MLKMAIRLMMPRNGSWLLGNEVFGLTALHFARRNRSASFLMFI